MRAFILFTTVFLLSNLTVYSQNTSKITHRVYSAIDKLGETKSVSVWIYFTDKGDKSELDTKKNSVILPTNSIKRRLKTFSRSDNLVTWYDIPVEEKYIAGIIPFIENKRRESKWLNAVSADVIPDKLQEISKLPFVKKIDILLKGQINRSLHDVTTQITGYRSNVSSSRQNDIDYGISADQNNLINVPQLHAKGLKGTNVVVCMMDAGYNNLTHTALQHLTILGTWDFVNNNENVGDEDDAGIGTHGTVTLSALAGYSNGTLIGPGYGAKFVLAKTENTESETPIEEDNWISAAEWAETYFGPDLTSTSLGYVDFDSVPGYTSNDLDGNTAAITKAADIAAGLGILVINSAGNWGPEPSTLGVPADGDSVLTIGATNSDGVITHFSSRGPTADGRIKPDVAAQGAMVVAASSSGDSYVHTNGTSLSCPLVAGAAALLFEAFPHATNMQLFNALRNTANNSQSPNNEIGWGVIDALAAYNYLSAIPIIIHHPMTSAHYSATSYNINCQVQSNSADILTAQIQYRVNGNEWQTVDMQNTSENNYTAQIPQAAVNDIVDYYIIAKNDSIEAKLPKNAPREFFSFNITTNINRIEETSKIYVAPNPVDNKLYILGQEADNINKITIVNSQGEYIMHDKSFDKGKGIDTSFLPSGYYYIEAKTHNNTVVLKFLKK